MYIVYTFFHNYPSISHLHANWKKNHAKPETTFLKKKKSIFRVPINTSHSSPPQTPQKSQSHSDLDRLSTGRAPEAAAKKARRAAASIAAVESEF